MFEVENMSEPTVRGTVHLIEETKTYGQRGFRKRLVVLEQDNGRFVNYIPFEFIQDGCDTVDELSLGDEVDITYRLSGRKWQRDETLRHSRIHRRRSDAFVLPRHHDSISKFRGGWTATSILLGDPGLEGNVRSRTLFLICRSLHIHSAS